MLKKIIYFKLLYLFLYSISNTILLLSYLFGKNKEMSEFLKYYSIDLCNLTYQNGLNSKIYYSGEYLKSNKIDILISNHINTLDFILNIIVSKYFGDVSYNIFMSKHTTYLPGIGLIISSSTDIKLNRKLKEDKDNIINSINKVKNGIIIIFPEGTRYSPDKHRNAIKYSNDNKLPVFNNTLFPKMKGLWLIINTLKKNNRLGNLIDISYEIPNFKKKKIHVKELFKYELGNTYAFIKTYKIPTNLNFEDYEIFKNWFLSIWKKKDIYLENMNKYKYKKLTYENNYIYWLSVILVIYLFIYFNFYTKGKLFIVTTFISYIIIFFRNKFKY